MGLPVSTFTESTTWMAVITASKATSADIGTAYNKAYREILESHQWSARKAEALINTVDPYTTGTVSVAQGGTTVTGVGTTFTSAMVDRYIRIGTQATFYRVATYTSATSIEIEKAWPYTAASGETFEIFQYLYTIDATAGEVGQILLPSEEWLIAPRSLYWISQVDPARRQSSSLPRAYILHGVNSTGGQVIEFWPRYSAAKTVRLPYYKRSDDLSGSNKPLIPSPPIESLGLVHVFSHLYTKFGAPEYQTQRDYYEAAYKASLEAALQDDFDRHQTPDAVQDQRRAVHDWDFVSRHDVGGLGA